MIKRILI